CRATTGGSPCKRCALNRHVPVRTRVPSPRPSVATLATTCPSTTWPPVRGRAH
ncbi:MAG: hypothetical protein AVDCRST_MAG73-1398, partial [uncultured Thermomicrobiales bacterium]